MAARGFWQYWLRYWKYFDHEEPMQTFEADERQAKVPIDTHMGTRRIEHKLTQIMERPMSL